MSLFKLEVQTMIERSPLIDSDSYDDLNSFQARAVRKVKNLTDRLAKLSTVDEVKEHSYIHVPIQPEDFWHS